MRDIPMGKNHPLGTIVFPLDTIKEARKLTLTVKIGRRLKNHWDFWVYPEEKKEMRNEKLGMRNDDNPASPDSAYRSNQHSSSLIPHSSLIQTMLIVEDSDDMREFLENNFREQYEVITAGDGIEALDQLEKHEVNIIISDWMMPRMDGVELCRRVRSNQLTSHIPFVMLTAKTDDDSKVEGMDVGADTYIEKPFSVQYLEACIRNILQIRRRLMEKFSTQPLEPVTEIAQNPTDNDFLIRMNKIIEENFSNSDLNVDFLADRLNISRSGLFAKIKTLADVTPNEMIQIVRLKRAAQLLHDGGYLVSEVGYMVGFSNPSYFSKCFQKQFGIRPADYMKSKSAET
jgi:DNA-binding response OmpR family regulator